MYFYPRPPRGGRPDADLADLIFLDISIHALREEGDAQSTKTDPDPNDFYPRPPRGGRPANATARDLTDGISIHALREEGDYLRGRKSQKPAYFYPRPPRGGRLLLDDLPDFQSIFLSTPSARRATDHLEDILRKHIISIHALREEGDRPRLAALPPHRDFYPRPPRGGRPGVCRPRMPSRLNFYPRPPRGGRLDLVWQLYHRTEISIHALREEGDAMPPVWPVTPNSISIHALREEGDP